MCEVEMCDFMLTFQCLSLIFSFIALGIFVAGRIRYGRFQSNTVGAIALIFHVVIFYVVICVKEYIGIDTLEYISDILGIQQLSYGVWSSAIRLQMVISILLMALTVVRREKWIRSLGPK